MISTDNNPFSAHHERYDTGKGVFLIPYSYFCLLCVTTRTSTYQQKRIQMTIQELIRRAGNLPAANIAEEVNMAMQTHAAVVITAPPGAGKSTLLPLTIAAGNTAGGKILMLEPRRLAARQIALRMADIIGEAVGKTVGYRIRFENKVSKNTRIEVLTEGILTRMLVDDATLDGVDTVIFDEFHERSINSDLALALVRQTQQIIRPDLKIVIMSATIDTTDLSHALHAPVIESEGRMFPITTRYATEDTPLHETARATARAIVEAHREQEGDILAFLPGQGDIETCADLLGSSLSPTHVYPLYGHLSPEAQQAAIAPSQRGERKVVLATSIAETSLTIEGVRTVIDSGLCRRSVFDMRTGLSHLETVAVSRDMAEQRRGRAGRVSEGTCIRLWTLATDHHMAERRTPEIAEADLSPLALSVAAFGENDITSLPWLTPPPADAIKKAYTLLQTLGATDPAGNITPMGKRMAALPCHPRIAKMILCADTATMQGLACDIAALVEEKDPTGNNPADTDMANRIATLRHLRRKKQTGRWNRIAQIAQEYRHMVHIEEDNTNVDPFDVGMLIAHAYPERIAMTTDAIGGYRLASGGNVRLEQSDLLTAHPWLAIASLHATGQSGRVFLAAPVRSDQLDIVTTYDNISWDNKQGCVVMQRERRIGRLIVDSKPLHNADHKRIVSIVCEAIQKYGQSLLNWNDETQRLQRRIAAVSQWHTDLDLPDLSTDHLLETANEWLPFYIEENGHVKTTAAELSKIPLAQVLWALIPYDQQQIIDRLAPTHITVPTGSRIRIDYRQGAEAPVLSVRLQECFGMTATPSVDDGKRPLLLELLSPGYKPVQLTQDLSSFWNSTYFEVRKELRRRYPKHYWPENPLEAEAVRGVKRKSPIRHLPILLLFALCCLTATANIPPLLPMPQKITLGKGTIRATSPIREHLVDSIPEAHFQEEAYRLVINNKGIDITATTETGLFRAHQTLQQLKTETHGHTSLPLCTITDWPAFRIRGFMHDTGRSFIPLEELKKEIDLLSRYKINLFHWHLTENQAWRLESRLYPQLNAPENMERDKGLYYKLQEVAEMTAYCKERHITLIPEIDMPGHSAAFERTFGFSMQTPQGKKILRDIITELCSATDTPYIHIGTDETAFSDSTFVPEMIDFVRSMGRKVVSWNPGWTYRPGEIDMTQLWSYRGKAQPGIPAIDCRFHYANHFDTYADLVALYNSRIYNQEEGSDDIAGCVLAFWNDRYIDNTRQMLAENGFWPYMLTLAERTWRGGGYGYFDGYTTLLYDNKPEQKAAFAEFEDRLLWHKGHTLKEEPFVYMIQTDAKWRITDAFPNEGELDRVFPPEQSLLQAAAPEEEDTTYIYNGQTYSTRTVSGNGIYLRHVWGTLVPGFYPHPQENSTAYASRWVYARHAQNAQLLFETQNYSRSESDLPPLQGTWDYRHSHIWLNGEEILPPLWINTHTHRDNEIPLRNENAASRTPTTVHLRKGWNHIVVKLPVGHFTTQETRLVKWMFTAVLITD